MEQKKKEQKEMKLQDHKYQNKMNLLSIMRDINRQYSKRNYVANISKK